MSLVLLSLHLPMPSSQLSSSQGLQLALPYSEGVRLDGIDIYPVVGQQLVGTVEVEVVVLHQQLLDVSEAVCQRRLRRQVQNEESSARRDHLVRVDHRCAVDALVEDVLGSPLGPLPVLRDEGDVASVLELEELGSS